MNLTAFSGSSQATGCFFTTSEKVAEELTNKGKRVHVVDPKQFFGVQLEK